MDTIEISGEGCPECDFQTFFSVVPSAFKLVKRSRLLELNQKTGPVSIHTASEKTHVPVQVRRTLDFSVDHFPEKLMTAELKNITGICPFIVKIRMNPVQKYFELAKITQDFLFCMTGFKDGDIRKILLKIGQYLLFLIRIDSNADAICMMLCKAVYGSIKIMTDMRRFEAQKLPVFHLGKGIQNFLLIRYQQKLVHPTTSAVLLEYHTDVLYPT